MLANDGEGQRSGTSPFCLFVVSQKKRNVRRSRLLMTRIAVTLGIVHAGALDHDAGRRSLLAPSDGAPASSTVSPASTCRPARSPRESAFIGKPMHHDTSMRDGRRSARIAVRPAALTRCRLSPADVE